MTDAPTLPTRSAAVAETLRDALRSGEYAPGERLHEERLTVRLGVSRTPVRAALQLLATEGLLDHAPNRGYSVRAYSLAEIMNAYEVRAVLEGLAARMAAERGLNDMERDSLERALADGDHILAAGTPAAEHKASYSAANALFHETIHAAAESRMLAEMVRLCQQVPVSSPRHVVDFEGDVRRRHDDHHRIFEAIIGREAWRAELLMRDHVMSVKSALIRSLSKSAARRGHA